MKSDKKDAAATTAKVGGSERWEREAAALRANLRKRKQQQTARQTERQAEDGAEEPNET